MDWLKMLYEAATAREAAPDGERPFPNEHAARIRNPRDFDPDSFRRTHGSGDGRVLGVMIPTTVEVIWGKLRGKAKPADPPIPQALRFPIGRWTAAEARAWLDDRGLTEKIERFEKATEEAKSAGTGEGRAEHAGPLADMLNSLVDNQATDEKPRSDVIKDLADAAGIEPGTVNQILNGDIRCPPIERLEAFAKVLDRPVGDLVDAGNAGGCDYPRADRKENGRSVRYMPASVSSVNLDRRELDEVQVMTKAVAQDGGIIVPRGLAVRNYIADNPVVLARHGMDFDARSPVIGNATYMRTNSLGLLAGVRFADTELGREYAYLYGVNDDREAFMRAWSIGWENMDVEIWSIGKARDFVGDLWDDDLIPRDVKVSGEVWAATRTVMNEFSAVPVGADRKALSRAYERDGIALAAAIAADMDLSEAEETLRSIREDRGEVIDRLLQEVKALRRDGASAATRGDSGAVLAEVGKWADMVKERKGD